MQLAGYTVKKSGEVFHWWRPNKGASFSLAKTATEAWDMAWIAFCAEELRRDGHFNVEVKPQHEWVKE